MTEGGDRRDLPEEPVKGGNGEEPLTTEPSEVSEEAVVPTDEATAPEGEAAAPEGEAAEPEGEAAEPEGDVAEPAAEPAVKRETQLSRLESIIFTSPEPISVRKLARILNVEGKEVRELLKELQESYSQRGIILEEISKGFHFRSHPENAAVIRDVFKLKPLKISRPALETLSIVAYRQPLTRAEVEDIRGVDCGGVLKYLFEKDLVRVIGRKEEPGRPIIYGTTKAFLELFGLKALSDLPALHEFSELWDDHQKIVDEEAPLADDGTSGAASDAAKGEEPTQPDERGEQAPSDDVSGSAEPEVPAADEAEPPEAPESADSEEEESTSEEPPEPMELEPVPDGDMKETSVKMADNKDKRPKDPSEVPTETINQEALNALMETINSKGFANGNEGTDEETLNPEDCLDGVKDEAAESEGEAADSESEEE